MEKIFDIDNDWNNFFYQEKRKNYYNSLNRFLLDEYNNQHIFPKKENVFKALENTSLKDVNVVIIGQDPYHSFEIIDDKILPHAHGLCFSISKECKKIPPSLKNIFKELNSEFDYPVPNHGNLTSWSEQGVLLLNATLTVRAHQAGSHQKKGWEMFTDNLIQYISKNKKGLVFLLWGNFAQNKEELIDTSKHFVLKSSHPSPFSARKSFFGCQHFLKTNELLKQNGNKEIDWQIK